MTLVVGIKCTDGIVLAADGAATVGSMGQNIAQQPTKKLSIIRDRIVMGVSGPVGLGQLLNGKMGTMWDGNIFSSRRPHEAMSLISTGFREYILPELRAAQVAGGTIGNAALNSAISTSLVAMPISGELCLFQFDQQGSPEQSTNELPCVSIGSGQPIADPFLALLRRVFWSDHQPPMNEGLFAAVWTVDHAIKVSPGGIAEPMQVIKMQLRDREVVIEELTAAQLAEHKEAARNAEQAMAESLSAFRRSLSGENAADIPEPATTGTGG